MINESIKTLKNLKDQLDSIDLSTIIDPKKLDEIMTLSLAIKKSNITARCSRRINAVKAQRLKKDSLRNNSSFRTTPLCLNDLFAGEYMMHRGSAFFNKSREINIHTLELPRDACAKLTRPTIENYLKRLNIPFSNNSPYYHTIDPFNTAIGSSNINIVATISSPSDNRMSLNPRFSWLLSDIVKNYDHFPKEYLPHLVATYSFKDTSRNGKMPISKISICER